MAMRTLYQKCKLVHGDLSEYNILFYKDHLYIIDVSQSVDLDHPHALDFLREDCVHVSKYFRKHGVAVMMIRELFDFIVDPSITDESVDSYLEKAQQKVLARGVLSAEDEIADSMFEQDFRLENEPLNSSLVVSSSNPFSEYRVETKDGSNEREEHLSPNSVLESC